MNIYDKETDVDHNVRRNSWKKTDSLPPYDELSATLYTDITDSVASRFVNALGLSGEIFTNGILLSQKYWKLHQVHHFISLWLEWTVFLLLCCVFFLFFFCVFAKNKGCFYVNSFAYSPFIFRLHCFISYLFFSGFFFLCRIIFPSWAASSVTSWAGLYVPHSAFPPTNTTTTNGYYYVVMHNFIRIIQKKNSFFLHSFIRRHPHCAIFAIKTNDR